VPQLPGIIRDFPRHQLPRRRSAIVVDEWGPFDYKSPRLWPVDSSRAVPLRLAVLGPAGTWRLVERRGVAEVSASSGRIGDTIRVTPHPDSTGDWNIALEYRGAATVSPRGAARPAGVPVRFEWGRFEPAAAWRVRAWTWADSLDPRTTGNWERLTSGQPVLQRTLPRLDMMWYRPTIRELPIARWALEASGTVTLPAGEYTLRTLSDDGIRVWVDGRLVIDNWDLHGTEVDHAPLTAGRHDIRVQFFQIDGWTELRLDIVKGAERSTGSPGPH
jgi:hypothetical protein